MNPQQPPPPLPMYASSLLPQTSNTAVSSSVPPPSMINVPPPPLPNMMYSPQQSFPPPPPPRGSSTLVPPPSFNSIPTATGSVPPPSSSIPPPTFMPTFGMMMPGFVPSSMGASTMNAFPSSSSSRKRSKESEDEEEDDEEDEEEEDQQPMTLSRNSGTPTKPPSTTSPSVTNTVHHQFMPQQYALPSSTTAHNVNSKSSPTPKKQKQSSKETSNKQTKSTQPSASTQKQPESLNATTSSSNSGTSTQQQNAQANTQPNANIPQKSIYHPFISGANALFGNDFICDESIRKLGVFINQVSEDGLEIEGKIGLIVQKGTQERISPRLESGCEIVSEAIIQRSDCEFVSRISQHTFKHVNKLLNERFSAMREAHKRGEYNGPLIEYKKAQETDKFFAYYLPASDDDERDEYGQLSHKDIRVTFDTKTDKPIRAMIKTRLERGDIDFSCPHRSHDFRVSFRKESSIDKFPNPDVDRPKKVRKKDRISYLFGFYRIDLTSVDSFNCKRNGEINEDSKFSCYEIEVECDVKRLFQVKSNLGEFVRHLKEFLDTLRMLCLVCDLSPQSQPPQHQQHQQHHYNHSSHQHYQPVNYYQPTQQQYQPPQHPPSLKRK
ncbi:hypothetical protein FDP41_003505 [Naegleria fowleri]|uniref:mRNA 5'-phosphatase n=1 Tax=Naegleria fowleri TaxID=5763 RepID=A0A6A5BI17_NAEFO|nr:uncharacterized protein FDP41_003505 [Naegleria fowleri]KAF0977513.1 hypothetical protein FDP41_003505 [Naegleria fowleri]